MDRKISKMARGTGLEGLGNGTNFYILAKNNCTKALIIGQGTKL